MTIRELLQTEIWSKRTSRKILIGLGIVSVGFVIWFVADRELITPRERTVAKVALEQIEALQSFNQLSDGEYKTKYQLAEGTVDAASQRALTSRDKLIAATLFFYLGVIDFERSEERLKLKFPHYRNDGRRDLEIQEHLKDARSQLRQGLHKTLD
jgi:hypothetical protein